MSQETDELGRDGEALAVRHLEEKGYRILGRRLRTPLGEIDVLAERGRLVVFVEVKTRRSIRAGMPREAVSASKARRIRGSIEILIRRDPKLRDRPCRVDLISVHIEPGGGPVLEHLEDVIHGA